MPDYIIAITIAAALSVIASVLFTLFEKRKTRKTFERIEEMLDAAIAGDFKETEYSEEITSRLETKLHDYLESSSISAGNVKLERDKIKTLISDISHQTKTPIANLLLHSELLAESPLDTSQKESLDAISRESEKLRFLIDSLVKLSRLENGILSLNPSEDSVSALMTGVYDEMRAKAERKGLDLILEPTSAKAVFDRKWTAEALSNIVDNAIKYTDSGSVRLSAVEYEMFVCLKVTDTGVGIAEGDIPRIFSRFERLEASRLQEGVGIGLYLAREIVSGEGGYIKVSSLPGKGSEFDIFLKKP
jgi:signal transduction histidine kinase